MLLFGPKRAVCRNVLRSRACVTLVEQLVVCANAFSELTLARPTKVDRAIVAVRATNASWIWQLVDIELAGANVFQPNGHVERWTRVIAQDLNTAVTAPGDRHVTSLHDRSNFAAQQRGQSPRVDVRNRIS